MQGFYDQEKFDEWRSTMESVFTKRLRRKQEKSEDDNYFTSKRASGESIPKFSRQSLELFEALDQGQKLAENIEFQFASQFEDLKEMSTMVALTAGATAAEVGINKLDCATEVTRSMKD